MKFSFNPFTPEAIIPAACIIFMIVSDLALSSEYSEYALITGVIIEVAYALHFAIFTVN